jgi:putative oxidoreductase
MSTLTPTAAGNPAGSISINPSRESTASTVRKVSDLAGRILLSVLFLLSGLGKIGAYAGTAAYMSSLGVPSGLLPLVIATEVLGALAIIVGWKTRLTAFLLAGFSLLTAVIFHSNFGDQLQMIMFFKNVSIAGGYLLLVANGAGPLSIDHRIAK